MSDLSQMREIDHVLSGRGMGRDALVEQSWRHCAEGCGPAQARPGPARIVTEDRLRDHRDPSEWRARRGRDSQVRKSHRVTGPYNFRRARR